MSAVYDDLIRQNRRASRLLLAGAFVVLMTIVWVVLGLLLGPDLLFDPVAAVGITAVGAAIGLALTYSAYRSGPTLALRAAKARPVAFEEAPDLHRLLDEVCVSAGLTTKPKLYVVDDPAPNAFATGLSLEDSHVAVTTGLVERLPRYELRAVMAHEVAHIVNDDIRAVTVAVTTGLVERLPRYELRAVMAHEVAHIVNDDIRAVTVAVATAGLIALLADVAIRATLYGGMRGGRSRGRGGNGGGGAQVVLMVVGFLAVLIAPLAAQLIRFAVSRQREYLADATAAQMLRDPQSMVDALRRLEEDHTPLTRFEAANAHLWFEEPNDLEGRGQAANLARRFATHPTLEQRIERLATLNAGTVDPERPLRPVSRPPRGPSDEPPPA